MKHTAIALAAIAVLALFTQWPARADGPSLEERVGKLEAEVAALKAQVAKLSGGAAPQTSCFSRCRS